MSEPKQFSYYVAFGGGKETVAVFREVLHWLKTKHLRKGRGKSLGELAHEIG